MVEILKDKIEKVSVTLQEFDILLHAFKLKFNEESNMWELV